MSKDWKGDTNSVYKIIGASNHAVDGERQEEDFYATSPSVLDLFSKFYDIPKNILECSAGAGHLSEKLKEFGCNVTSWDIVDRGYPLDKVCDFLQQTELPANCDCILSNPPYSQAMSFVLHSLELLPNNGQCIMFLKTTFLEGKERLEKLFGKYPPKYIYVFSQRQICAKNGIFENVKSSAVSYSFFVWVKGSTSEPIVRWI